MKISNPTSFGTGTPTAETVGATGVVGTATGASRADHRHALLGSSPQADQTLTSVSAAGTSGAPARFDHVHGALALYSRAAADTAFTNSTVLANITGMTVTLAANAKYLVRMYVDLTCAFAGVNSYKINVTGPAAPGVVSGMYRTYNAVLNAFTATTLIAAFGTTLSVAGTMSATGDVAEIVLLVETGAAGGALTLQGAQTVSSGNTVTYKASSWIDALRVG